MYARSNTLLQVGAYSDLLLGKTAAAQVDFIDATIFDLDKRVLVPIAAGSYTIDIALYTKVYALMIRNEDPTNYVTLTYRSAGGAAVDQVTRIFGGAFINPTSPSVSTGACFLTGDVTVTTNPILVANTATCYCRISVIGK
jgi:hypothetical protein